MQPEEIFILSKNILSPAKGQIDVGFTHSLNPYSGCAFSCLFCYVREMPIQKYRELSWGSWIDIKTNAAENYRKEVRRLRSKGAIVNIFMSTVTDPYQPIERKINLTRSLLEEMIESPPDLLQIQTRSPLITRDLDLLVVLKEACKLLVSMIIETDREDVKQIFAPYAPGIRVRLKTLKTLKESGITTQASVSPVLPFTPEFPELLIGIVDTVWIDPLNT
ncbi:radical SAM protein [Paenibacillus sp. FSL F4-0122]|uniref:SPL family radical SAM protein n=1 Tax=Paenibacillus sp. FSL F4-0122 TaxID=2921371 RepID=UPI0030F981A6